MRIGIDARAAKWVGDRGVGKYTNKIIENLKYIDHDNNYLLFYHRSDMSDMFRSEEQDRLYPGKGFWQTMHNTQWGNLPDVDIFHNTINGFGIPTGGNHKLVITIHDLNPFGMLETSQENNFDHVLNSTSEAIEKADRIITMSHHAKKKVKRYFNLPDRKINVIYHGVDEIFKPMDKGVAFHHLSKKYQIHDKFILNFGGFGPRNNIPRLIRAFKMICNEFPDGLKLIIIGNPEDSHENLIKLTKKLSMEEHIIFPGTLSSDDLLLFYNACEAFVYPSLYEGAVSALLEASACGVPIIASRVSTVAEIMGDSCTYVNPYSIVDIAQGIYDTLINKELSQDLLIKGLSNNRLFSWEKAAKETIEVYKEVMQQK